MSKQWYVLRVQSGREEMVKESLERRAQLAGLGEKIGRVVVPTEQVTEIKGGKKRVVNRKIYPGYIMIELDLDDESWYLVRETPGIGDFISADRKPVPMRPAEAERVLRSMERKEEPELRLSFKPGDAVKIKEGPFENFDGVVEEVNPQRGLVRVVVTIFGRATPVELEYWQVEPL